jgi:hypothetical protein
MYLAGHGKFFARNWRFRVSSFRFSASLIRGKDFWYSIKLNVLPAAAVCASVNRQNTEKKASNKNFIVMEPTCLQRQITGINFCNALKLP